MSSNSAEVSIEPNAKVIATNSAVVGDSIRIKMGAVIQNVFYNEILNQGTIQGTQNSPLALPVVGCLPTFPTFTAGNNSITISQGSSLTLQAGDYGDIFVSQSATLNFAGGVYNVNSIQVQMDSKLFFDKPAIVRVKNEVRWAKGVTVGPSTSSSLDASSIIFFVQGATTINEMTSTTELGKDAVVNANIYAPNGQILMKKGTKATGAFIANTVTIEMDSTVTYNSGFECGTTNTELIISYSDTISELAKIGAIADESVVTDYLNHTITNLKNDTNILVSDIETRQNLLSILDSALSSVTRSGAAVLALDDLEANIQINQTRLSLENYINTVKALNGTKVSIPTANFLFAKANQISADSLKRGINLTQIIAGIPLVFTSKIIDRAKADISSTRNIVSILESRGFTVTVKAQHLSPTQGIVSFFNNATSQIFNFITPDLASAVFSALTISEDMAFAGVPLTGEQETSFLISGPFVIEKVGTMPNVTISEGFRICIDLTHILEAAARFSKSRTLGLVTIGNTIGCGIGFLIQNPELVEIFVVTPVLDVITPPVTISGLKFNDLNGNHVRDAGELPLSGFGFSLSATGFGFDVTRAFNQTDSNGVFTFNKVRVPPTSTNIVISEELSSTLIAQGWTNTTDLKRIIPFRAGLTVTDITFGNRIPPPPETVFLSDSFENCFDTGWVVEIQTVTCTTDNPKDGTFAMKLQKSQGVARLFKSVSLASDIQKISFWFYPSGLTFSRGAGFITTLSFSDGISFAGAQLIFGLSSGVNSEFRAGFQQFTPITTLIPMATAGQYHNAVIEYDKINRSIKLFIDGQLLTTRFVTQSLDLNRIQFEVGDSIVWVDSVAVTGRSASFTGDGADYAFCDAASGIGWEKAIGATRISCSDQNVKDGVYSIVFIDDVFAQQSLLRKSLTRGDSITASVWFNPSGSGEVEILLGGPGVARIVNSYDGTPSFCEAGTSVIPIVPVQQGQYHNVVLSFTRINATHAFFGASVGGQSCGSEAPSEFNPGQFDLNAGIGRGASQVTHFDSPSIGS